MVDSEENDKFDLRVERLIAESHALKYFFNVPIL